MDTPKPTMLSKSYLFIEDTTTSNRFKTMSDCLCHFAEYRPNQSAFVFVSTDGRRESITWKTLYEQSVNMARGLIQLGVKRNEVVAVNVRSCPKWLYVNFGIILARAIAANISFTYTDGSDIITMMNRLETCSTMVLDAGVDDNDWSIFRKFLDDYSVDGSVQSDAMPSLRHLILLERPSSTVNVLTVEDVLTAGNASLVELPMLKEDDVIVLFQTSGSTGVPKLVTHTHTSLLEFCRNASGRNRSDSGNDTIYNDRPFNWIGGWPRNVVSGDTRVTQFGMSTAPDDRVAFIFDVVKAEQCNQLVASAQLIHAMMARGKILVDDLDWPSLYITTGGQPLTKDVTKCIGVLCKRVRCGYGGTECGLVSEHLVDDPENFEEFSSGRPITGTAVKIVDEKEEIVPVGERGEIMVRSPGVFKGYWNDKEKTKSALTADGWFKTDDIGHLSNSGNLFAEGRKSDIIISGGMNVSPTILETVLKTYPNVRAVMVVPIPHPVLYQEVCACVIPIAGSDVTEESLRSYCESTHNDKPGIFTVLPKYYIITDAFPETRTGKPSRKEMAAIAERIVKDKS